MLEVSLTLCMCNDTKSKEYNDGIRENNLVYQRKIAHIKLLFHWPLKQVLIYVKLNEGDAKFVLRFYFQNNI